MGDRKDYSTTTNTLYATNGYSGTDADLDNSTPVDNTDGYSDTIDLTKRGGWTGSLKHDSSGTTDNVVLKLFRIEGTTWDGDETEVTTITVTSDGSEDIYPLCITRRAYGAGYFRLSMQSSGGTDTFDVQLTGNLWD